MSLRFHRRASSQEDVPVPPVTEAKFQTPRFSRTLLSDRTAAKRASSVGSDGKWIISGTSTYTGATTVSAGTLLVSGALGNSAVGVSNAGTAFGGSGSLAGSLTLNVGTLFYVADLSDPLLVTGAVSLYSGFGVDDLAGGILLAFLHTIIYKLLNFLRVKNYIWLSYISVFDFSSHIFYLPALGRFTP